MILTDMQHSHPPMTLYREVIFLCWCGRILRKVESTIMILLSASLASFSPHPYGETTMIL